MSLALETQPHTCSRADVHNTSQGALKPAGAAVYLSVSKDTLARWRCHGEGPAYVKFGRSVVYRIDALDAYLLSHELGGGVR